MIGLCLAWLSTGAHQSIHFALLLERSYAIQLLEGKLKENQRLPDLLLVDLKMPGMNGFDFLAWLKQHQTLRALPAIVFSGSTLQTDVDKAYCLGPRAYIYKPLKIEDLMESLKSVLGFWSRSAPSIILAKER